MKEDILEQLAEDYLQSRGYFTRHNVKFKPSSKHKDYDSDEDAVNSDIDIIAIHPRRSGPTKVVVVTCKSWQGGFDADWWLKTLTRTPNKTTSGREAWRSFRELTKDKWTEAYVSKVSDLAGTSNFTYMIAVTRLAGNVGAWRTNKRLPVRLRRNIEAITVEQMLSELVSDLKETPESSDVGRLLQVVKASGHSFEQAPRPRRYYLDKKKGAVLAVPVSPVASLRTTGKKKEWALQMEVEVTTKASGITELRVETQAVPGNLMRSTAMKKFKKPKRGKSITEAKYTQLKLKYLGLLSGLPKPKPPF